VRAGNGVELVNSKALTGSIRHRRRKRGGGHKNGAIHTVNVHPPQKGGYWEKVGGQNTTRGKYTSIIGDDGGLNGKVRGLKT